MSEPAENRPKKHSLTLHGHRTSVSLEDDFWVAFCDIAEATSTPINKLASEIDDKRGVQSGLASAIRLFILNHYRRGVGDITS